MVEHIPPDQVDHFKGGSRKLLPANARLCLLLIVHLIVQRVLLVALMRPFGWGSACDSVILALLIALALGVFLERRMAFTAPEGQGVLTK